MAMTDIILQMSDVIDHMRHNYLGFSRYRLSIDDFRDLHTAYEYGILNIVTIKKKKVRLKHKANTISIAV